MFLTNLVPTVPVTQMALGLGLLVIGLLVAFALFCTNVDLVGTSFGWANHLQHLLASTVKLSWSQAARVDLPSVLLD